MTSIKFFNKSNLNLPIEFTESDDNPNNSNLSLTAVCFEQFIHLETEYYLIGYVQSVAKLYKKLKNTENELDDPVLEHILTIKFPIKYNSITCLKILFKKRQKINEILVLAGSATGHLTHFTINLKDVKYKLLISTELSQPSSVIKILQQTDDEIQVLDTTGKIHVLYLDYLKNVVEVNLIYSLRKSPALDIVKNSKLDTLILTPNNIQRLPDKEILVNFDRTETSSLCCIPNDDIIFSKNNQLFQASKSLKMPFFTHESKIFTIKPVSNYAVFIFDELESIFLIDLIKHEILLKLTGVEFGYQSGVYKGIGLEMKYKPVQEVQNLADSCSCKNLIEISQVPQVEEDSGLNFKINLFLKSHFIEVSVLKPVFSSEFSFQLLMNVNNGVNFSLLADVYRSFQKISIWNR